jgi:tRNA (guanine-N7-)-methyltransferase
MIEAMLGLSKRNIETSYNFENPENLYLIRANVERLTDVFESKDLVERIYINFCNPWPKKKHNKKRLTHPRQLIQYKELLTDDGKIYFKKHSWNMLVFKY